MRKPIVIIMSCFLFLSGCKTPDTQVTSIEEDRVKIGICFDSFVVERWYREQDVFVAKAEDLGAQVYAQNANGDITKQKEQINYLIGEKVDVIIIVPTDSKALSEEVKKAKAAGIKVIAYDRMIANSDVDLYMTFDNEEIGHLMAKRVKEEVPWEGKVVLIMGAPNDSNVVVIDETINEVLKNEHLSIIYKTYADNWQREEAFKVTAQLLNQGHEINGIICGNDDLAGEAIKALAEKCKAGNVTVIGQDADLAACQRIVEGTQDMTVFKDVTKLAEKAAEYAVAMGNGEELLMNETIFDGTYDIPCYTLSPIEVTKENMDAIIIDGGFHLKEDVYLNVVTN